MKYTAAVVVFVTILSACHSNSDINSTSADSSAGKKPQGYVVKQLAGLFYDTLPCADCPGIATKLYLKPDKTFVLEKEYISKSTSYETGVWAVNDSLLQLTGTDSPQHFKIISYAKLSMLTNEGKEIQSGTRKMELDRNNVPFRPLQPVPVEGIYSAKGDTMTLHICSMNHDYGATLDSGAMMMTEKYKKVAAQGQPIYAKLAGHFELRPSLNDTTTQDFFVIEKFIKFIPDQTCK